MATNTKLEPSPLGYVETQLFHDEKPLKLESGLELEPITLAYEMYGTLSPERDNAILLLHALSGDANAAGNHRDGSGLRWWEMMVGPGRAFDTDQFCVICSNILGGCSGSTGPSSINPATGEPYGMDFPIITIGDMVNAQCRLTDHLGISKWYAMSGGSMGGMQALQWAIAYPDRVARCIPIATTQRQSAQSIAFDAVGRAAIMSDPNWLEGRYYGKAAPDNGLSVARMLGHITYLSEQAMHEKFGRALRHTESYNWDFNPEFSVETYLRHQGDSFVKRFDANSYLYITKAMDYFDLSAETGSLAQAMQDVLARFLVISFTSDWLYPTEQSREIVRALRVNGIDVSFVEIESSGGHDSFLLEAYAPEMTRLIKGFLKQR